MVAALGRHNFAMGAFADWPAALRTAVNMMLASRFPMFIAWGPDLPYLYNDALIPIVGARHPQAFARPFREVWPEAWDNLGPLLQRALTGESSYHENWPIPLERGGKLVPTWFTFSYSPLFDEAGQICGVLSVAFESTQTVLSERRHLLRSRLADRLLDLADPSEIIAAAADVATEHLGADRSGYAEIDQTRGIALPTLDRGRDDRRMLADSYRIGEFGPWFMSELAAGRAVQVENSAMDTRLSGVAMDALATAGLQALLVVPLVKAGQLVAAIYSGQGSPRQWSDEDTAALREVGERSWAAVERARAEARVAEGERELRQMTDALPVLISHVDAEGRYRFNNRAYEEWFGNPREKIFGKSVAEVVGAEAYKGLKPFVDRALAGEAVSVEQLVPYKDGGERHVHVEYVPRRDRSGAPQGYYALIQDIGEQKRAEAALRRSEQRLRAVLESVSDGFFALDPDLHVTLFNRACERHFDRPREDVLGRRLEDAFPQLEGSKLQACLAEVLASGEQQTFETDSPTIDGHVIEVRAALKDGGGVAVSFSDITDRRRAESLRQLLLNELNHRVKNTLAVVQGLAAQSFKADVDPDVARRAFGGRLRALAAAHDLLTARNWAGAGLQSVVIEAIQSSSDPARFAIDGPDVQLSPQTSVTLAIALHELCTNAVKYGALAVPNGRVDVCWTVLEGATADEGARLKLVWRESGGPPVVEPTRRGFGSRMLEQGLSGEIGGTVRLEFAPSGLVCRIEAPLPAPGDED